MITDKATGTSVNMSPAASDYTHYELTKTLTKLLKPTKIGISTSW